MFILKLLSAHVVYQVILSWKWLDTFNTEKDKCLVTYNMYMLNLFSIMAGQTILIWNSFV